MNVKIKNNKIIGKGIVIIMNICFEEFGLTNFDEYYQLRCERENIYWTGYMEAPQRDKLKSWCTNQLKRNDRTFFLVKSRNSGNKVIGYVYIDRNESTIDISYAVGTNYTGNGLGSEIIYLATKYCKDTFKSIKELDAWVIYNNIRSIKCFTNNNWIESEKYKKIFLQSLNRYVIMRKYIYLVGDKS